MTKETKEGKHLNLWEIKRKPRSTARPLMALHYMTSRRCMASMTTCQTQVFRLKPTFNKNPLLGIQVICAKKRLKFTNLDKNILLTPLT